MLVRCARRAGEDVVPFEDVGFGGMGGDVFWRGFGEGGVFAGETLVGGAGGHDGGWWLGVVAMLALGVWE